MSNIITVELTTEELAAVERTAHARGMTIAQLLRWSVGNHLLIGSPYSVHASLVAAAAAIEKGRDK